MNNPFDYIPDAACDTAFRELVSRIDSLKLSCNPDDIAFCRELEQGKMLGVLIATEGSGAPHTLYAFSGQLGRGGFAYPGFVEPVFDYLLPDGYFKRKEGEISRMNADISAFERGSLTKVREEYEREKIRLEQAVGRYREKCRLSKLERDARRNSGLADESELESMVRRSQFEKAELRRLKLRMTAELEPLLEKLNAAQAHLSAMKEKRRADSEALQAWLFSRMNLLNARGESRSVGEIFENTPVRIPPSGAGECCAPKLLQAAYRRGWRPVSMAEYWYGKPKGGELRVHGEHYPACRGKCLPLLEWMLEGLDIEPPLSGESQSRKQFAPEIIFENQWFCVVNKPSGMLSVPGKGREVSLQQWLAERYGAERDVRMAHRLDQDTSGLIVATFGHQAYKEMQALFATRNVHKTYVAELEGDYESLGVPRKGHIGLPLSPDWLDRPRQRVDLEDGKPALTEYEFVSSADGRNRIEFHPLTGRTHQLRVHSASEMGLGMPIVGDRLYGRKGGSGSDRLHLHALRIEFTFPPDGRSYCFEAPLPDFIKGEIILSRDR